MTTNIVFDAHSCLPLSPHTSIQTLHRYHKMGVRYISINIGMDCNPISQIMNVISSFRAQIKEDTILCFADNIQEIQKAICNDQLAVAFDLEGAVPLQDNLDMVSLYKRLGVRQIHFAYNRNNSIAGGCHDKTQGLTQLGKAMLDRVQEENLLMDMSHNSIRTTLDICAYATKPVLFSHSNAFSLVPHPRNITDEQIKACAQTKGIICVNGVGRFLGEATTENFAHHCAYIADLVGWEYVGMGLDTMLDQAGIEDMPRDINLAYWWPKEHYPQRIGTSSYLQPEDIPDIHQSLLQIGFHQHECDGILYKNLFDLFERMNLGAD